MYHQDYYEGNEDKVFNEFKHFFEFLFLYLCLLLNGKDACIKFIFYILYQINDSRRKEGEKRFGIIQQKKKEFPQSIQRWFLFLNVHIGCHRLSYTVISFIGTTSKGFI